MNKAQKERERLYLASLKRNYTGFPKGTVEETEEPDFIVRLKSRAVGIELTELAKEGRDRFARPLRASESERDKAVRNACKLYERDGLPPVDVAVIWFEHHDLISKRRRHIEQALVSLVKSSLPNENECVRLENTCLPDSSMPEEIHSLRIARFDFLSRNHWAVHAAGYIAELDLEMVGAVIRRKTSKLLEYRRRCSEVWLAIVVEGLHLSSLLNISDAVTNAVYETAFDKVLLLRYFEEQVLELQTEVAS